MRHSWNSSRARINLMFWTSRKGNNNDDNNNNELRIKQQKNKKRPIFIFCFYWFVDGKCVRIACRCLSIHGKQLLLIRCYWIFHDHRFMFPGRKWAANCSKSIRFQRFVWDVEMIKFYGVSPFERFGIFRFIYLNKLIKLLYFNIGQECSAFIRRKKIRTRKWKWEEKNVQRWAIRYRFGHFIHSLLFSVKKRRNNW